MSTDNNIDKILGYYALTPEDIEKIHDLYANSSLLYGEYEPLEDILERNKREENVDIRGSE